MPRRPLIEGLPEPLQDALESRIAASNYAEYEHHTLWLNEMLAREGLEIKVARSTVAKFGKKQQERADKIADRLALSTEVAKAARRQTPDEEAATEEVAMRLVQSGVFEVLEALGAEGTPDLKELAKAGHLMADLARARAYLGRYQREVKERLDERLKALEEEAQGASRGPGRLDPETLRRVREEVYGIV